MYQASRPAVGTPVTCLVEGHKYSGRIVRVDRGSDRVVLAVTDDGYTNHVSFPVSSIIVCPKCNNAGVIMEDGYIEKGFCDCPAGQDLCAYLKVEPKCIKCRGTGWLNFEARKLCDCQQGRIQQDMMLDGAFDGL